MNRQITAFLAVIFACMFSFVAKPEAQDIDKTQVLSAIQQSIIPIAAFTAQSVCLGRMHGCGIDRKYDP